MDVPGGGAIKNTFLIMHIFFTILIEERKKPDSNADVIAQNLVIVSGLLLLLLLEVKKPKFQTKSVALLTCLSINLWIPPENHLRL